MNETIPIREMNAIIKATSVTVLVTLGLTLAAWAAETAKPEAPTVLDKLVGQPVDLAPWAFAWRADREVQEKPEAYFISRRLERLDKVYRTIASRPTETDQDRSVVLRLRHPKSTPLKGVTVNGTEWKDFNPEKETITLQGLSGTVTVTAKY